MKRALFALLAAIVLVSGSGCGCLEPFQRLGQRTGGHEGHGGEGTYAPSGPSVAQVTYPYYTTRGPRDFLAPNPRGIGR